MSRAGLFLTTAAASAGCLALAGLTWHVSSFLIPAIGQFLGGVPFTAAFAFAKGQLISLGIEFLALLGLVTYADRMVKSPPLALLVSVLLGGLTVICAVVSIVSAGIFGGLIATGTVDAYALGGSGASALIFGLFAVAFGFCFLRFREWAAD